jgi:hypothetical protein
MPEQHQTVPCQVGKNVWIEKALVSVSIVGYLVVVREDYLQVSLKSFDLSFDL